VAHLALIELGDLELHGVAEHGLVQIELELVAQIRAAEHLRAPAAPAPAEDIAEHIPEDVAEGIPGPEAAAAATA